ncbi:MAG: branched-chain amino acid ABC transporter permease [Nitratireductor sp.]|nr:branched-chain amino acid ABC transporter permease [Nitratireductor sp.]MCB1455270.1 branched-chain amino acid ABC transporter permease [Nitratireductor sp.]
MAYFAQQIINGIHLGALYALLAFGYAIAHGVLHRASFLHGALFAFAGQTAVFFTAFGWNSLLLVYPAALALGALAALIYTAFIAHFLARHVIQPLRLASPNMTIAASLAVLIVLMEAVRLASGNWSPWLSPFLNKVIPVGGGGFVITTTTLKLAITLLVLVLVGLASLFLRRSRAGLVWRAVSQDEQASALMGIDAGRIFVLSLTASGLVAALAGVLAAWHYGNMDFATGISFAVKILFLTSLGGLSSPPTASIGGLAIGLFEALWDGWFPLVWRDAATYCILVALLVATRRSNGLDIS